MRHVGLTRRVLSSGVLGALASGAGLRAAEAQSSLAGKTIKLVYPFAAGNGGDVAARLLAEGLSRALQASVIVDNHAGAAGRAGAQAVIRADPSGETLLFAPLPLISIYPHAYRQLGYDPFADLRPVSLAALFDLALVTGAQTQFASVADLVAWAKANPSTANYGSPGAGGIGHLFAVLFAQQAKIEIKHVSYRGAAPALIDLVGGQIPFASLPVGDCLALHKAGSVRMLAVSGARRLSVAEDVPTLLELGFPVEASAWYGVYAPAKTPDAVVDKVSGAIRRTMTEPGVRERLDALAITPQASSPAELERLGREASALWAPAVAASGFTPEP